MQGHHQLLMQRTAICPPLLDRSGQSVSNPQFHQGNLESNTNKQVNTFPKLLSPKPLWSKIYFILGSKDFFNSEVQIETTFFFTEYSESTYTNIKIQNLTEIFATFILILHQKDWPKQQKIASSNVISN